MSVLPTMVLENVLRGVPKTYNGKRNIGFSIINRLKTVPPNYVPAVDSLTKTEITAEKLLSDTGKVAQWLRNEKIGFGTSVGFCAENRIEYVAPVLATLTIGATCAPLNPIYTIDEMMHIMEISEPKVIFCSSTTVGKLMEALSIMQFHCQLVVFDDDTSTSSVILYSEILEQPLNGPSLIVAELDGDTSVGVILCSSGTTGLPKCVELTHANLNCFVACLMDPRVTGKMCDNDILLGLPPFFHGFGFGILLLSLTVGMKLVTLSRFTEKHFLETIETFKVTLLFVVPPILVLLAKHPLVIKYNLSSVRMIRCGAAPLSRDVQLAVQKRLNIYDVEQAYGMTEASIACVFVPQGSKKIGSSGVICPGMDCKIIDIESGRHLKSNEKGEICFKGPFLMKGYRKNKKETEETIDKEGWLHTGDIGYYDSQGFLYIVDRLKELIKYKGYQVAPAELEAVLLTHKCVKDAAVIGIPDEMAGELPFAFVVRQPNANISHEELKKFVAGKVSAQKRLSGGIKFVDEIPKNASGKILRRVLRAQCKTISKF